MKQPLKPDWTYHSRPLKWIPIYPCLRKKSKNLQHLKLLYCKSDFTPLNENKCILGESSESKLELKTPEIIQMFTNKSTNGLRQKLSEIERDLKVGKITKMEHERSKLEIFKALLKLNQITEAEKKYLIETNPDLLSVDSNDTIEDVSKVFSVIQKSWEICRIKYFT